MPCIQTNPLSTLIINPDFYLFYLSQYIYSFDVSLSGHGVRKFLAGLVHRGARQRAGPSKDAQDQRKKAQQLKNDEVAVGVETGGRAALFISI
jgi:hypothetical protein